MRDYSFGNHICKLREDNGLSQFQLGRLVGVSDKAVSKWENGLSKPRMATCVRLANVLGVSVDELLVGSPSQNQYERVVTMMEQNLWKCAEESLRTKYGKYPPAEFVARLETEKQELKGTEAIIHIGYLRELRKTAQTCGQEFVVRGTFASVYVAWLLGATVVNATLPHTYCPRCRKVKFHPEVRDGWDIPRSKCECGADLVRDGHNIPYQIYTDDVRRGNRCGYELGISHALIPQAVQLMKEYYQDLYSLIQVIRPDRDYEHYTFLLIPCGADLPKTDDDGILRMSSEEYWEKYHDQRTISFIPPNARSVPLRPFTEADLQMCMVPDVFNKVYQKKVEEANKILSVNDYRIHNKSILAQAQGCEMTFSLLLQLCGLMHGTSIWEENGEILVKNGSVDIMDLAAFRDDIILKIQQSGLLSSCAGQGLAVRIMNEVRRGRYHIKGMSEEDAHLLEELGMPNWFIEHIKKIAYAFPKDHTIEFLLRECIEAAY